MTKPVLTCDICKFKGSNSYIFKRHLHRCYSLHGIASKRSSPRNPVRLKGTENLHIKPLDSNSQEEEEEVKESAENCQEIKESTQGSLQDPTASGTSVKSGNGTENVCSSLSQWGVSDSPLTGTAEVATSEKQEPEIAPESIKSSEGGSEGPKSGAPYARHYTCNFDDCAFKSKSAREHLYHLRDVHGNQSKIHECNLCEYASRYHNKIERHMVVHKLVINMEDRKGRAKACKSDEFVTEDKNEEDEETEETVRPGGRLRVKPLKLRRLNVKMPFKVSGENADSKSPPTLSPETEQPQRASGIRKSIVHKRVQQADGSFLYQCQDCLYYARLICKVKKHHGLCHSKLLRCPHCDFSSTGQGILYEHLVTHSGHGYVQCPDCSYVTNAKSNYEKHRTFHEAVFPCSCSVCNFGADSENKIKRHVTTQHTPLSGTIDIVSLHETTMDTSQESAKETEADTTFENQDEDMDKTVQSQSKEAGSSGGTSKIEYKCPKCVMVCYRRANFTRHLTARHGYSQLSASQLSKSVENKLFKTFKRRVVSGPNRAGAHGAVTENLKCPHCSYLAKWPSDLRRHTQVHTVLKRFKCSICPNKYKYLGDLNVHVRRDHHVEPPENVSSELTASGVIKKASPAIFRCPICPFSCHSKAALEQHSRGHSNITKTYQCRMCDYQTYWRGDVGRHLFRHHEIVLSKEATEIEEYFILRPDIRPLTKQGPASMSNNQAVFPRNPDPPMILDLSTDLNETNGELQEEQNDVGIEKMEEDEDQNSDLNSSDTGPPKLIAQSPLALGPVCLKDGSFVCEYPNCDFKSTISDRMEVHLALHLNIKMFMCPTCGKRTNWKWDIVKHMNKVHMNPDAAVEDVITLSMEDAKASIGEYMATFERKSRELSINKCSLCDFKSLEKNRVVRHMGTVHKNQNGKVISQVIENPKELDINTFAQEREKGMESNEMKSTSAEQPTTPLKFEEPPPEELAKFEKPYACAICKKPGVTKGDVKKHYNYTHPYKDVRVVYVADGTEFNYYTGEIYLKNSKSFQDETSDSNDSNSSSSFMSAFSGKSVRPDSKYSNPKMHGYVKPFKCSICGIRSNWKWDLKKHLRSKHPSEGGFVIMLSIEEASQTYGTECSPSHPAVPVSRPSVSQSRASPFAVTSTPSPTICSNTLFKSPFNIKEEKLDDSDDDEVSFKEPSFSQQSPQHSSPPSLSLNGKGERGTFPDPSRRQWKCSGCDYISNWRRNMARHIHRKHRGSEGTIKVVALHKLNAGQLASLPGFSQQSISPFLSRRCNNNGNKNTNGAKPGLPEKSSSNQNNPSNMRLWRCTKCSFKSVLKTHIIAHMQQHGIKPFKCGVCHMPFMNRGPLHKHLQKLHKCGDYIRQCKVVITYSEDDDGAAAQLPEKEILKGKSDNSIVKKNVSTAVNGKGQYINSYFCRLCNIESTDRQEILNHLEAFHNSADNDNNVLKIQKRIATPEPLNSPISPTNKASVEPTIRGSSGRKLHFCHVCPYRTQKKQMLAFHMTYHRPTASNRFKCKYCPYYVSTVRLLHQHQRKWHESAGASWSPQEQKTPPSSPFKAPLANSGSPASGSGRRHMCEKCPYTTNSKNDFIYHKQFHRPKRTAEFKCEYCDYWVVHKRLLKQHVRLHTKQPESDAASVLSSPAKSLYSDPGLVYDPVELTELAAIKQKMISAKVTASLSRSPVVSPMKLASSLTTDTEKPSYVLKKGLYRKLHRCKKCPYTNVRARNMQLHEMMHGPRPSPHPLMKCPYCDYHVGSKGLLSHHMKVHQKSYGDTPENDAEMNEAGENGELSDHEILPEQKVDTLLQISRFKRFGCEKCPYASAKRQHFERHLELHGSRQRYTCQYCDYSVPSNNLLLQHTKLHMMPNQNLLASQSVTNLHHLSEVPADVALASALPPADTETTVTISVIHDHLGLYENSIYDSEPKKLYRCDRCPYANVRRDYLLLHLKFHMVASAFACPYCDYSAPKQALLNQHVRVHFCPLPELSDWLLENGQTERETSHRQMDLGEALKVARDYQTHGRSKAKSATEKAKSDKSAGKENVQNGTDPVTYICQYCDREFPASETLIKHELQHLIGNHFERTEYVDRNKKEMEKAEHKDVDKEELKKEEESNPEEGSNLEEGNKETAPDILTNGISSQQSDSSSNDNHLSRSKPLSESNDAVEKINPEDTPADDAVNSAESKTYLPELESTKEVKEEAKTESNDEDSLQTLNEETTKTKTDLDEEQGHEHKMETEEEKLQTENQEEEDSINPTDIQKETANGAIDEEMQVDEDGISNIDEVQNTSEKAEVSCGSSTVADQSTSDISIKEHKEESTEDMNEKDLLAPDDGESTDLKDIEDISEHDVKLLEDND